MDRSQWQAALPGLVADLARRWSLRLGEPFEGGTASWVTRATMQDGTPVVLKVGFPHFEALHEADGLQAWKGEGAVRLLARHDAAPVTALLLEACEPGTPLEQIHPPQTQDEVVADLARRLWIEPGPGHPFRPLSVMCEQWAAEFERDDAAARDRGEPRLDPGLARAGVRLFRDLPADADESVLLCTDLHHGNVLAARREPWLVIDPKPYVGDPAYDALQHMINFPDRLTGHPGRFAARMADLLGVDTERLTLWLFARCAVESADADLRQAATLLAP